MRSVYQLRTAVAVKFEGLPLVPSSASHCFGLSPFGAGRSTSAGASLSPASPDPAIVPGPVALSTHGKPPLLCSDAHRARDATPENG